MMSHGHQLENGLYWRGLRGYEPETLPLWFALSIDASFVLDIGANTGLFSLLSGCAAPKAEIHAFEPVPRIATALRGNVALNPDMNIVLHEVAVGEQSGVLSLYDPGGDLCYSASLNPNFLSGEKSSYPVNVVSIDEMAKTHRWSRVDLVKLDVEGYEEGVLLGMSDTLERYRPIVVMESLNEGRPGRHIARLLECDYTVCSFATNDPGRGQRPANGHRPRNVLLVPAECRARVESLRERVTQHS